MNWHRNISGWLLIFCAGLFLSGCSDHSALWREQKLPSGRTVKVMSTQLAWGSEHEERIQSNDCFVLEFVYTNPEATEEARESEAKEVFELIRPISEQWGFTVATLSAYKVPERRPGYDFYIFQRGADGRWSCKKEKR